jgi:hypothetical protein
MTKPLGALRLDPHAPGKLRTIPWPVCKRCGLVYFRNDATAALLRQGCWVFEDEINRTGAAKVTRR